MVFAGPFEHHSNILPWRDADGVKVVTINENEDGEVDLEHLEQELKAHSNFKVIIFSLEILH